MTYLLNSDTKRVVEHGQYEQSKTYEKYIMKDNPRKMAQEMNQASVHRLYLEKTQLEEMNQDLVKEVGVLRQVADVNVDQMGRNQMLVANFRPEYKKCWDALQAAEEKRTTAENDVKEQNFKYVQLLDHYDAENKRIQKELDNERANGLENVTLKVRVANLEKEAERYSVEADGLNAEVGKLTADLKAANELIEVLEAANKDDDVQRLIVQRRNLDSQFEKLKSDSAEEKRKLEQENKNMIEQLEQHAMEQYNFLKDRSTEIIKEREDEMAAKEAEINRLMDIIQGLKDTREEEARGHRLRLQT